MGALMRRRLCGCPSRVISNEKDKQKTRDVRFELFAKYPICRYCRNAYIYHISDIVMLHSRFHKWTMLVQKITFRRDISGYLAKPRHCVIGLLLSEEKPDNDSYQVMMLILGRPILSDIPNKNIWEKYLTGNLHRYLPFKTNSWQGVKFNFDTFTDELKSRINNYSDFRLSSPQERSSGVSWTLCQSRMRRERWFFSLCPTRTSRTRRKTRILSRVPRQVGSRQERKRQHLDGFKWTSESKRQTHQ